jgi:hypothetical protein
MAYEGGKMARVVRKRKPLKLKIKAITPKTVSVSATIPFDGDITKRFGYMEKCFTCGFDKLVDIKDESLLQVVKRYCSRCNTEWVR